MQQNKKPKRAKADEILSMIRQRQAEESKENLRAFLDNLPAVEDEEPFHSFSPEVTDEQVENHPFYQMGLKEGIKLERRRARMVIYNLNTIFNEDDE